MHSTIMYLGCLLQQELLCIARQTLCDIILCVQFLLALRFPHSDSRLHATAVTSSTAATLQALVAMRLHYSTPPRTKRSTACRATVLHLQGCHWQLSGLQAFLARSCRPIVPWQCQFLVGAILTSRNIAINITQPSTSRHICHQW